MAAAPVVPGSAEALSLSQTETCLSFTPLNTPLGIAGINGGMQERSDFDCYDLNQTREQDPCGSQ